MDKKISDKLLKKYLVNECTQEETELIEKWLVDPRNKVRVNSLMKGQWDNPHSMSSIKDSGPHELLNEIHKVILHDQVKDQKKGWFKSLGRLSRIAVILLVPMTFIGLFYFLNPKDVVVTKVSLTQYENSPGQRSKIKLPDESVVWLNAESRLSFPKQFDSVKREVLLEGEAFFEVVRKTEQPFIVKAGEVDIRVLGTSFNVSAFPRETMVETTLVTGKVALKKVDTNEGFLTLSPNQKALYNKERQSFSIKKVDHTFSTSWKDGYLKFDNAPFKEVIKKIERWYGVEIRYDENLKDSYNLTFTLRDESLEKILQLMKSLIPIQYQLHNKIVKIEAL